jgi:DNA polymerase
MPILLYLDTETYSEVPIVHGTHHYAENAEVIMWQWALDDGEVNVSDSLPTELIPMLTDDRYVKVIHNSNFDRTVIRYATGILIPTSQIFDTMVCALAHSLPGGLDQLGTLFNLSQDKAKDKEGKKLINLFCKLQKQRKTKKQEESCFRATRETHPAEWDRFCEYGGRDIVAMREIYKLLPKWNMQDKEHNLWQLDQKINDRGIHVDLDLCHAAIRASDRSKKECDEKTTIMTNGAVTTTNRRDVLIKYIEDEYGDTLPDLTASRVKSMLGHDKYPEKLLELLEIRLISSKTSKAKYKRVINGINKDGRLRGLLQFCGASRTGRWAGRLFQPQNLPRPTIKGKYLEEAISELKNDACELISNYAIDEVCSSALRGIITAKENNKLVIADLSNIEGRVLAWLSREEWKCKAFNDFDKGKGADLYNLTYAKAFDIPVEQVEDSQRQIGKVMELAFGYQGGVGAWITFAKAYGIDLEELAKRAFHTIPNDTLTASNDFLIWHKSKKNPMHGLSDRAFLVCDSFKRLWRIEHNHIQEYWDTINKTTVTAIQRPGHTLICGYHKIRRDGDWLRISLPSGRYLCYPHPKIEDNKISYMGVNQFSRKWERLTTYGGKLVENITQAVARDILAAGMTNAEEKGYEIILTVHDEIIAEVPNSPEFTQKHLSELMSQVPIWAAGLPLAAKGFETNRYQKG